MTNITENGEIVVNSIDERGRCRIDSILDDGTIVIVPIVIVGILRQVGDGLTNVITFS